jgi:hypothetical protein
LSGSSLATAFEQATRGAGANKQAAMTAEEARRREDLRRADLQMLYQFILQPNMARYANDRGIAAGENAANKASKSQNTSAGIGAVGSIVGALAGACNTADELYGRESEEAMLSRWYMAKHADGDAYDAYQKGARDLADEIKVDPKLRAKTKETFDHFVEVAKRDFPTRFK